MNIRGINKRELLASVYNYLKCGDKDEIMMGFSDEELNDVNALEELMDILASDLGGNYGM